MLNSVMMQSRHSLHYIFDRFISNKIVEKLLP